MAAATSGSEMGERKGGIGGWSRLREGFTAALCRSNKIFDPNTCCRFPKQGGIRNGYVRWLTFPIWFHLIQPARPHVDHKGCNTTETGSDDYPTSVYPEN